MSKTDTPGKGRELSVADDSLDQMVQAASTPSLATLFQRAKDAGLIKPVKEYGTTTT